MPFFNKLGKLALEHHIQHEYSQQMAQKSEVVCFCDSSSSITNNYPCILIIGSSRHLFERGAKIRGDDRSAFTSSPVYTDGHGKTVCTG